MGFTTNSRHHGAGHQLVGQSLAFLDAVERASRAAPLNRPVLVIGERGTGKELIAERLHHLSPRWSGPLVTMNCAALPENLIEAELFGHEAGSFTGASKTRHGRFEEADGGTLFLDELATLSSPAQDRLLRAVEYGEITRIGASKPISVDVRIVAATNEHLPRLVEQGRFRADCSTGCRSRSSLCRRCGRGSGDIPLLAEHFARRMAVELDWPNWPGFRRTSWPSSRPIRGRATCASCATSSSVPSIAPRTPSGRSTEVQFDPFDSPWTASSAPAPMPQPVGETAELCAAADVNAGHAPSTAVNDFRSAVTAYERALLEEALARNRFNQRATAAALGLSYDQLRHALKRHRLQDTAA